MRIDDMKPGPELDYEFIRLSGLRCIRTENGWLYQAEECGKGVNIGCLSESWEGMRIVVEEMQRRGFDFCLEKILPTHPSSGIRAQFGSLAPVDGDTAPHAVTLAAIKALQGEDTTDE